MTKLYVNKKHLFKTRERALECNVPESDLVDVLRDESEVPGEAVSLADVLTGSSGSSYIIEKPELVADLMKKTERRRKTRRKK